MSSSVSRFALVCVAFVVIRETVPLENEGWWTNVDQNLLEKVNFPLRVLCTYENLISRAEAEKPECALNHTLRFDVLNKSIEYHWNTCLRTIPKYDLHQLLTCMEDRAKADVDILLHDLLDLTDCIGEKDDGEVMTEAEWAPLVAEVKNDLPAVKKNNEFYVAVENARLNNKENCYDEFWPLVAEFTSNIDIAVSNCRKFVPVGKLEEFRKCCEDLTQPTMSDIESKLLYVNSCVT